MRIIESTSGSGNDTYEYTGRSTPNTVVFTNDGAADATIVVNAVTITVKPGECFEGSFEVPYSVVDITATGDWRLIAAE